MEPDRLIVGGIGGIVYFSSLPCAKAEIPPTLERAAEMEPLKAVADVVASRLVAQSSPEVSTASVQSTSAAVPPRSASPSVALSASSSTTPKAPTAPAIDPAKAIYPQLKAY